MGELKGTSDSDNVNVTLGREGSPPDPLVGKQFPCSVCGTGLPIRISRKGKPYCVCDACGIQVFFRGKLGIRRLREIIESETLVAGKGSEINDALTLYNRIQQLRAQKKELEAKQGLIFRDGDLDCAIRAVDNEIERVQGELRDLAENASPRRTK